MEQHGDTHRMPEWPELMRGAREVLYEADADRRTAGDQGTDALFFHFLINLALEKRLSWVAGLCVPGGRWPPLTFTVTCLGGSATCVVRNDGTNAANGRDAWR
jgi:hypothetical protein